MERISIHDDPKSLLGHVFRYRMATGFLAPNDTVLDCACGVGYGSVYLHSMPDITYFGVDRSLSHIEIEEDDNTHFIAADLCSWDPDFDFDVFISFETIEHLSDYTNLLKIAKRAKKWVLLSVPVVPTKHVNQYHVHDFTSGELRDLFQDDEWHCYQSVAQPLELAELYVFYRSSNGL